MFGNLLKPQHSSFLDKSKSSMVPLLSKDENENQENKQASKFTKLSKQSFKSYVIKNKSDNLVKELENMNIDQPERK